jgi:histidinol-phosphate/aromatic aminotransferase/cobyric acid decarboxylase-like protein
MKYNKHLDKVVRMNTVNTIGNAEIGKRLHACERTVPFDALDWHKFMLTLTQEDFINYPDDSVLKQTIAGMYNVAPENVMLFSGADGAISCAFQCFTKHNTQVIMPEYHFPMYDVYTAQNACEPVLLKYDGLTLTHDTNIPTTKPSLVVMTNPNSPVGDSPSLDLFTTLERYEVPIVVDSVYSDFGCTPLNVHDKLVKNYIFVYSLSKSFGGAGARVGYAIAKKEIIQIMAKMRPMFPIMGASVKFAQWVLTDLERRDHYVTNTVLYRKEIARHYPWNIGGNWVHVPQDVYFDKFTAAGFTFKSNVMLPMISSEPLIRISATSDVMRIVSENFFNV